jgi:hypothetical protein
MSTLFVFFAVLETKLRASCMLGQCSISKLCSQPLNFSLGEWNRDKPSRPQFLVSFLALYSLDVAMTWVLFHCCLDLRLLKFNSYYVVLRGWKFNLTMVFRGGAFGKWLRSDNVMRVELPRLNLGHFVRRGRETSFPPFTRVVLSLTMWCSALSQKAITRCGPLTLCFQNCEPR